MKRAVVVFAAMFAFVGGAIFLALMRNGDKPVYHIPIGSVLFGIVTPSIVKNKTDKRQKTRRMTLYIRKDHYQALREISEATGIPLSTLVGLALDLYLTEKLEVLQEPKLPPIPVDYLKRQLQHAPA